MLRDAESCCRLTEAVGQEATEQVLAQPTLCTGTRLRVTYAAAAKSTRGQDTTTASCAAEERFRDLRAFAVRRGPRRIPIARPIALLTHSAASWSSMWPAVGWCRWTAPGMAAAMSREWDAGVSMSVPPLTTNVLAAIDSRAWYTS